MHCLELHLLCIAKGFYVEDITEEALIDLSAPLGNSLHLCISFSVVELVL